MQFTLFTYILHPTPHTSSHTFLHTRSTLAAIVSEFRFNWLLVADVLRGATSMSGNYRRPDMCKVR